MVRVHPLMPFLFQSSSMAELPFCKRVVAGASPVSGSLY